MSLADRVQETSTTTGTGDVTLAGASAQCQSFNSAFGTQKFFPYAIKDANGTAWETGRGYLSASTTLVRAAIFASTNSNNAINLSAGTHTVFCSITAEWAESLQGKSYATARAFDLP